MSDRFKKMMSDLGKGKQPDAQTSKPSSTAKSKSPDYSKLTCYLPKPMHKRLKAASVDLEVEMSEIVEQALDAWMSEHLDV